MDTQNNVDKEYHQHNINNRKKQTKYMYCFHLYKIKNKIKTIQSLGIQVRLMVIFKEV